MKKLDDKYFYSSEDNGVFHLYRNGEKCDNFISNPLISAIYKIEQLEKDNKEFREKVHFWKKEVNVAHKARSDEFDNLYANREYYKRELDKAKEIIKMLLHDCYSIADCEDTNLGLWEDDLNQAKQFIGEVN